jgi:5'-nucleotidase
MTNSLITFTILHTNDLHSAFESMPRIRSYFQSVACQIPQEQLFRFDIGDHMDRMRPETDGTFGGVNIEIMNATGYDVAIPGNNEGLTFTAEMLEHLYGQSAHFPIVATNLDWIGAASHSPQWNKRSVIFKRCGVSIGVIGLTAPFQLFYQELGWHATDPFEAARQEIQQLRNDHAVEVIIVLSHLGLSMDEQLAAEVTGIDLILGGHTHHLLENMIYRKGVAIAAAGKLGHHVGHVQVQFDPLTRRVISSSGGAIPVIQQPADPFIDTLISSGASQASSQLKRVVAYLEQPVPLLHEQESVFGNLLAAALRRRCQAEIGLVNTGQLLAGLEQGDVTSEQLLTVCPSPINPAMIILRGKYIWQAIEQAMDEAYIYRPIRGFGFRGYSLGTLCMDGMTVEVVRVSDGRRRIKQIWIGSNPLDWEKSYVVGTIDMFTFRIGYESLGEAESVKYFLPEFIRDVIAQTLASAQQSQLIDQAKRLRIHYL